MRASYSLLQHIPNPFRQEASNVGLIVAKGDDIAAQFFGEKEDGSIARRRLKGKGISEPGVYVQWVEAWRYLLKDKADGVEEIRRTTGANFRLLKECEINGDGDEAARDILKRLYPNLVEGRQIERASERAAAALSGLLEDEFQKRHIFGSRKIGMGVKYPVYREKETSGAHCPHSPSFIQENGKLCVMEAVDGSAANRILDRAKLAAYTHQDIQERHGTAVESFSIINSMDFAKSEKDVLKSTKKVLDDKSTIVDWANKREREKFLANREGAAYGSSA